MPYALKASTPKSAQPPTFELDLKILKWAEWHLKLQGTNQQHTGILIKKRELQAFTRGFSEIFPEQHRTMSTNTDAVPIWMVSCTLPSCTDSEGGNHARALVRLAVVLVVARDRKGRRVSVANSIQVLFL